MSLRKEEAKSLWREKIYSQASEVDPGNDYVWEGVAVGFFMAFDYSGDEAREIYRELISEGTF